MPDRYACHRVRENRAVSAALEAQYGYGLPRHEAVTATADYPLTLVSPSSDERTNATFGGHPEQLGLQTLKSTRMTPPVMVLRTVPQWQVWNTL
ncbi:MAG: hypothetical protein R3E89_17940 [Thiolinea sp.]